MFSAQTASSRRSAGASAAQPPTTTTTHTVVHSRWESARDHLREQFAADPAVAGRRGLQLCLGVMWLLDAALQYQPFMFRPSFVTTVVEPAATGNPGFVTTSVNWASHLMLHQPAFSNAVVATIQLLIAVGLFFRRTVKPALALSIVWALSVWWFGESLGGILVGMSPIAGVPGAVLLYALIAILIRPASPKTAGQRASVATAGRIGATAAKLAWVALWGTFAHYLLLPANRAPAALSEALSHTDGEPGWLAATMSGLSRAADHRGVAVSVVLALLCVGIALAILAQPLVWPALVLAATLGMVFCLAQGLGGIFTGQGTDPSTGPLLILLSACYLPRCTSQAVDKS
jgi:hypothetical protein